MTVVQVEVDEEGVTEGVGVPVHVAVADPLVGVLVGGSGVKVFVINWVGVEVCVVVAEPVGTAVGLRVPVKVAVAVLPAGSGQVAQGPWEILDLHPTTEKAANSRSMVPVI